MSASSILLSKVEDSFEIAGRGCVIVPGLGQSATTNRVVRRGQTVRLLRPNGTTLVTQIHDLEFLDGSSRRWCVPVLLPPGISKSDVPIGTEVWLDFIDTTE